MQNVYANCMVKAKAADCGCLHVNVEEKCRVQLSQNLDSLLSDITAAN